MMMMMMMMMEHCSPYVRVGNCSNTFEHRSRLVPDVSVCVCVCDGDGLMERERDKTYATLIFKIRRFVTTLAIPKLIMFKS